MKTILIAIGAFVLFLLAGPISKTASAAPAEKAIIAVIPGFAGSSLYTCPNEESSLSDCVLIYGDNTAAGQQQDLTIKSGAIYKPGPLLFSTQRMYDSLSMFLSDYAESPEAKPHRNATFVGTLRAFPYDWRLSVRDAAKQLDKDFCALADEEGPLVLYVIAHSMGGLVIKDWLYSRSVNATACSDRVQIKALAFVGSPLLGAPKTISDLLNGLRLTSGLESFFDYASPSITQAALWLPSAYDLLPIRGSLGCLDSFPKSSKGFRDLLESVAAPVVLKETSGKLVFDDPRVDVYKPEVWADLHFLRLLIDNRYQIPSNAFIEAHLSSAEETACRLLKFDVGTVLPEGPWHYFSHVYIASKAFDTIAQMEFDNDARKNFRVGRPDWELGGKGDGTVPWYSASFLDNKRAVNVDRVKGKDADHIGILESEEMKEQFRLWLKDEVFWTRVDSAQAPGIRKAELPFLEPMLIEPRLWQQPQSRAVVARNKAELQRVGVTVMEVIERAKELPTTSDKMIRLITAASLIGEETPHRREELLSTLLYTADLAVQLQNVKVASSLSDYIALQIEGGEVALADAGSIERRLQRLLNGLRIGSEPGDRTLRSRIRVALNKLHDLDRTFLAEAAPRFRDNSVMKCVADGKNWCLQLANYSGTRYSRLDEINTSNVGNLKVAWSFSTGVLRGHEGSPLVIGSTMYVHTPFPNIVYAIDIDDGNKIIWKYTPQQDPSVISVMCCDTVNRGLQYADGKVFLYQADTTLVALDGKTGNEIWKSVNGDPKRGESGTSAPFPVGDVVLVGVSGGEFGVRGFLTAYDIDSGRRLWRAYSSGPDEETLFDPEKTMSLGKPVGKDSSLKTWNGDQWKLGGGSAWGQLSYDPVLDLVYYGTGNPGTSNPAQRAGPDGKPIDQKWSTSIIARNPQTGIAAWAYQMTPFDEWDYDGVNEMILVDGMDVKGSQHNVLVHFDRNGFAYTVDRKSGLPLVAAKYDPAVNWSTGVDLDAKSPTYGRPAVVASKSPFLNGTDVSTTDICPASLGAKNQPPAAYSPLTGLFYVPTNHVCMDKEPFKVSYAAGQPYVGATLSMYPPKGESHVGNFIAWDASIGKIVWSNKELFSVWSGVLTTAGGIACYGTLEGYLKCVDQKDGRELYKNRAPSGIIGNVFTYEHKGKQYIGVYSGVGGWAGIGLAAGLTNPTDGLGAVGGYAGLNDYTALGGMLTVLALP